METSVSVCVCVCACVLYVIFWSWGFGPACVIFLLTIIYAVCFYVQAAVHDWFVADPSRGRSDGVVVQLNMSMIKDLQPQSLKPRWVPSPNVQPPPDLRTGQCIPALMRLKCTQFLFSLQVLQILVMDLVIITLIYIVHFTTDRE